ncbi:hypothetical protein HDK90DRAFT_353933 [Phyllosticta capitalensis]|uniref:Secreted protein n=1 Tax=Phyllosticta capitalensis TaxID=121624 RepID=A0ABR1YHK7_9PEZI
MAVCVCVCVCVCHREMWQSQATHPIRVAKHTFLRSPAMQPFSCLPFVSVVVVVVVVVVAVPRPRLNETKSTQKKTQSSGTSRPTGEKGETWEMGEEGVGGGGGWHNDCLTGLEKSNWEGRVWGHGKRRRKPKRGEVVEQQTGEGWSGRRPTRVVRLSKRLSIHRDGCAATCSRPPPVDRAAVVPRPIHPSARPPRERIPCLSAPPVLERPRHAQHQSINPIHPPHRFAACLPPSAPTLQSKPNGQNGQQDADAVSLPLSGHLLSFRRTHARTRLACLSLSTDLLSDRATD